MDSYITTQVNRTGRWIRKQMRGNKEEFPERVRLGEEIMQFLVKRETSLADALEALTTVMLHVLSAEYGKRDEFFRFFEQVSSFLESTERDRAIGLIPLPGTAKVPPRTVTMVESPEGILRLATEVGELITKCGAKSLQDGINALTGTMVTAIESACGRERADEFDLLLRGFSTEVHRFAGGRAQ